MLSGSILLLAVFTIGNVFTRTLFGESLAWAEELSRFLMVLVTFVGLSYAAGRGRHIRMTALYDQLPDRPRKALAIFIAASTSALLLLVAAYAVQYVVAVRTLGTVSPALRVPLWWVWLTAPLGLVLGSVQYALTTWRNLTSPGIWLSFDRCDTDVVPAGDAPDEPHPTGL